MHNGIAIALAWPETLCKQAGAWYDLPMKWVGFNKNNYYKVGHAAIVLVKKHSESCHYFDFGRCHAPHGHGRVRSSVTDHDLEINTKAKFNSKGDLINLNEILEELYFNESCHGTGDVHASITNVNFQKAFNKANKLQEKSPLPYGPFTPKGTNCSRFVNSVIIDGIPQFNHSLKLIFPISLTPTPMTNVKSLHQYTIVTLDNVITEFNNKSFQLEKIGNE